MKDYFREFIIPTPTHQIKSGFADASTSSSHACKTPIKTHIMWALVAGSVGVLSWKGTEIYTKYKLAIKKDLKK